MPAIERERTLWVDCTLWVRQQNEGRKGRKGRKPRILRKWGPFRGWREAAETGGNPLQELCSRNRLQFPCLAFGVHAKTLIGVTLAEIAETPRADPGLSQYAIALPAVRGRQEEGPYAGPLYAGTGRARWL
jgi:hypothetical protein